jgi:hypothetical protein
VCPCAASRCCCDSQNALWKEGVLSLRCHKLAAVDPQNAPEVLSPACACRFTMSGGRKGHPALPCKLAAVVIHRMLWWKKGVPSQLPAVVIQNALVERVCYPCAVMHASCHDPQNAMVRRVCYPCAAMRVAAVVIHRMLWCKEGCAIPALSCKLAAVMIHALEEGCAALPCSPCDPQNSGGRKVCYPLSCMQAAA